MISTETQMWTPSLRCSTIPPISNWPGSGLSRPPAARTPVPPAVSVAHRGAHRSVTMCYLQCYLPAAWRQLAIADIDARRLNVIILMTITAKYHIDIMRGIRRAVIDTEFVHLESVIFAVVPSAHDMLCAAVIEINYSLLDDCVCGIARHDPTHSLCPGIPESSFPESGLGALLPLDRLALFGGASGIS
jgi:hypothetical protein